MVLCRAADLNLVCVPTEYHILHKSKVETIVSELARRELL
jgi:hypothetical protein